MLNREEMRRKNYKPCETQAKALQKAPPVILTKSGKFYISRPAYKALGSPEAIIYLFDQQHRIVALKASSKAIRHAYVITCTGQGYGYEAAAKRFLKSKDISHQLTQTIESCSVDGMLILYLEKVPQEEVSKYRFQEFTDKYKHRLSGGPRITLLKNRELSFDRAVYGMLGEPRAVTMHYSLKHNAIGLRPAEVDDPNGYPIRYNKSKKQTGLPAEEKKHSFTVSAHKLMACIGIKRLSRSEIFKANELSDESGAGVTIKLDTGLPIKQHKYGAGRSRNKRRIGNLSAWLGYAAEKYINLYNMGDGKVSQNKLAEHLGMSPPTLIAYLGKCEMDWGQFKEFALYEL